MMRAVLGGNAWLCFEITARAARLSANPPGSASNPSSTDPRASATIRQLSPPPSSWWRGSYSREQQPSWDCLSGV